MLCPLFPLLWKLKSIPFGETNQKRTQKKRKKEHTSVTSTKSTTTPRDPFTRVSFIPRNSITCAPTLNIFICLFEIYELKRTTKKERQKKNLQMDNFFCQTRFSGRLQTRLFISKERKKKRKKEMLERKNSSHKNYSYSLNSPQSPLYLLGQGEKYWGHGNEEGRDFQAT